MKTPRPLILAAALTVVPGLAFAQVPAGAEPAPAAAVVTTPSLPVAINVSTPVMATPAPSVSAPATLPASTKPAVPDPVVGDSDNTVFASLGRPNGVISLPDKSSMLIYDRGTVVVSNGTVTEVKLISQKVYAAKMAADAADAAERALNTARVNALLQMLLTDPSYKDMATRDRMVALAKFDREHPGSDAPKYLADLSAVYSAELTAQAHIQELQSQVDQARSQANAAQQQVSNAQQQLIAAQQTAATLKAQADAARQQAAQATNQLSNTPTQPPLVTNYNNSNVAGTAVGGGGLVMTPSNHFGTSAPPTSSSSATPGGTPAGQATEHLVMGSDGQVKMVGGPATTTTGN